MKTFVKSFVVVVAILLGVNGCAQNKDGGGASYCTLSPTAPDCVPVVTPTPGGTGLALPTEPVMFPNETDPTTPLPIQMRIMSLTPKPDSRVVAPYFFTWNFWVKMEPMQNQFEAVTFDFFPSDDCVNPSGPRFANGSVRSGTENTISNAGESGTGVYRMEVTMKCIVVKARWLRGGVGPQMSTQVFKEVNIGK